MNKKKTILITLLSIISLFSLVLILYKININKQTNNPIISVPKPIDKIASFKEIVPGETSLEEVNRLLGNPTSATTSGNITISDYKSSNEYRKHQVETENGNVLFVKEVVNMTDKINAEEIRKIYGIAPYILYEKSHQNPFDLYVYPSNGIAYIGHEDGTVSEIWYFKTTTINNFISQWGSNYSKEPSEETLPY